MARVVLSIGTMKSAHTRCGRLPAYANALRTGSRATGTQSTSTVSRLPEGETEALLTGSREDSLMLSTHEKADHLRRVHAEVSSNGVDHLALGVSETDDEVPRARSLFGGPRTRRFRSRSSGVLRHRSPLTTRSVIPLYLHMQWNHDGSTSRAAPLFSMPRQADVIPLGLLCGTAIERFETPVTGEQKCSLRYVLAKAMSALCRGNVLSATRIR
jgi:hypothetical protein